MDIERLITCEKVIERKRRPEFKEEARHYRMNIDLKCVDIDVKMIMFLRRLKDFPEDFTVGLRLVGPNEIKEQDIAIVRYQGPHGGQSVQKSMSDLHNGFHIHEYTQDDIDKRRKRASYKGPAQFGSFEEAIVRFMERCNIKDPNGIFADEKMMCEQIQMDFDMIDENGGDQQ